MDSHVIDDLELLRRYAQGGDDQAFAALVQRHVNLVYSVALRQLNGDAHLAADAAQLVFADLARKARALTRHRVLAGWLFTSARFAAAKLVRSEQRRHVREQEAQLMQTLDDSPDPSAQLDWRQVRPVLDEVIAELGERDREAILLRFFEGRDYASIGAKLHLAANAARMRVERALEKLRAQLERRGVRSTSAALAGVLVNQAVVAAPAGLAATLTGAALAGGSAVAGATAAGVAAGGTAAGFMTLTKLQIGLATAVAAAGATGLVVQAQTNAALRAQVATLRSETAAADALKAENLTLARTVADAADMRGDDADFTRLQEEAAALKTRLQQLAQLEQQRAAAAAEQDAVYRLANVDRQPSPRFQARPQYPFEARRAGIGAKVVVDFVVDREGNVRDARALRTQVDEGAREETPADFHVATTPGPEPAKRSASTATELQSQFEAAAVQAVSKWKFKPGQKADRAVNTQMQIPIVFTVTEK